jgi:hypothetical protein
MSRVALFSRFTVSVALIAASAATATGTTYASEATSDAVASTTSRALSTPPGTSRAQAAAVPGGVVSASAAWDCEYGYPCLFDGDNGTGSVLEHLTCGFHDLGNYSLNDWANSARTYGNSITVYNWNDSVGWDDWGTVPAWKKWNFQLKNQIDGVRVNC